MASGINLRLKLRMFGSNRFFPPFLLVNQNVSVDQLFAELDEQQREGGHDLDEFVLYVFFFLLNTS